MSDIISWVKNQIGMNPSPPAPLPPLAIPAAPKPDNFQACFNYVLLREGGFVDNPNDAGRATNMGITAAALAAWRDEPVTTDDVRTLTRSEAGLIYRANFWNVMKCPYLPAGIDLSVFDPGVMSGPERGVKFLQGALHIHQDGQFGDETMAAVRGINDVAGVIAAIAAERLAFYDELVATIPADTEFLAGWKSRAEETLARSLGMVGA